LWLAWESTDKDKYCSLEATMFCTACGCKLADGSKFCGGCGAKVVAASSDAPKTDSGGALDTLKMSLVSLADKGKVFIEGDIPDKKLSNAIEAYAQTAKKQDVLLLVDDTVFGSAKDGFLVTSTAIYAHQMGVGPRHISFDEISSVSAEKQKFGVELRVNGLRLLVISTAQKNIDAIAAVLNAYAINLKGSSSGGAESSYKDFPVDELSCGESDEGSDFPEDLRGVFFDLEDSLMEKSVLVGIAPKSMVSVTLTPQFYDDSGEQKIKCTINVECSQNEEPDDEMLEQISDAVLDYLNDAGFGESIADMGYEDMLDWLPVQLLNVNEQNQSAGVSKRVPIGSYFMLRVGVAGDDDVGDFIDNINPSLNVCVAYCGESEEFLVVSNDTIGTKVFPNAVFAEVVDELVDELGQTEINSELLLGLFKSTVDSDADGLIDVDQKYEDSYFEASETEDVADYRPCVFGVGSVTRSPRNCYFDLISMRVIEDDNLLASLGDLYGRIDEDSTWVVGARL